VTARTADEFSLRSASETSLLARIRSTETGPPHSPRSMFFIAGRTATHDSLARARFRVGPTWDPAPSTHPTPARSESP